MGLGVCIRVFIFVSIILCVYIGLVKVEDKFRVYRIKK